MKVALWFISKNGHSIGFCKCKWLCTCKWQGVFQPVGWLFGRDGLTTRLLSCDFEAQKVCEIDKTKTDMCEVCWKQINTDFSLKQTTELTIFSIGMGKWQLVDLRTEVHQHQQMQPCRSENEILIWIPHLKKKTWQIADLDELALMSKSPCLCR